MQERSIRARRAISGLTAVELLVVMTILAILASLAAPTMQRLIAAQRLRSGAYDLIGHLTLARSEAVKRGSDVTLTTADNGWTVASGATTLARRDPLGSGVSMNPQSQTVTFSGTGRPTNVATVTFELVDLNSSTRRCIKLDPSGRPKSTTSSCSA
jgi:type IV fimbrial biogenesis protein FimT